MNDTVRTEIEAATVHLPAKQGQGVLVAGGLILTAAHCVEYCTTGRMALGDDSFAGVETRSGLRIVACVMAVEPVTDIAVLGPVEMQASRDDGEAFDSFVRQTNPVRLFLRDPGWHEWFPVSLLSHRRQWILGKGARFGKYCEYPTACLSVETEASIESGTSGGPVVDDNGELLGVVSWGNTSGSIPFAKYALPRWAVDHIAEAQMKPA